MALDVTISQRVDVVLLVLFTRVNHYSAALVLLSGFVTGVFRDRVWLILSDYHVFDSRQEQ